MHKNLDNVIGVGGFPGVGKSTLVGNLYNQGFDVTFEFSKSNVDGILKNLFDHYKANKVTDAFLLQMAFLNHTIYRYQKVVKRAKKYHPVIVDRTIIEDVYFAFGQIRDEKLMGVYKKIWDDKVKWFGENIGFPSHYIHLTNSFEVSMLRLESRDPDEVEEKRRNVENFKRIFSMYKNMKTDVTKRGIEYFKINTDNKDEKQVLNECLNLLAEKNLIDDSD